MLLSRGYIGNHSGRLLAKLFRRRSTLRPAFVMLHSVTDFIFPQLPPRFHFPFLISALCGELGSIRGGRRFLDTVFLFSSSSCLRRKHLRLCSCRSFPIIFFREFKTELTRLSRTLLLSPILLGSQSFLESVLQTFKRFFVYATSPLLYNIRRIFGIFYLYPRYGLRA